MQDKNRRKFLESSAGVAAAATFGTGALWTPLPQAQSLAYKQQKGAKLRLLRCLCAPAETGTLVLTSSGETPASTHLLPETHIALVPASRIVAGMEEAFALMRTERGGVANMMPRVVNMVSGPSRTGDIEQTIVLGAHGPYRVHIIIATAD